MDDALIISEQHGALLDQLNLHEQNVRAGEQAVQTLYTAVQSYLHLKETELWRLRDCKTWPQYCRAYLGMNDSRVRQYNAMLEMVLEQPALAELSERVAREIRSQVKHREERSYVYQVLAVYQEANQALPVEERLPITSGTVERLAETLTEMACERQLPITELPVAEVVVETLQAEALAKQAHAEHRRAHMRILDSAVGDFHVDEHGTAHITIPQIAQIVPSEMWDAVNSGKGFPVSVTAYKKRGE